MFILWSLAKVLPGSGKSSYCFLQCSDIDLFHFEHGGHGFICFCFIRAADQVIEHSGTHLPWKAEFVFEPAALLRILVTAFRKLFPIVIDLILGVAIDD